MTKQVDIATKLLRVGTGLGALGLAVPIANEVDKICTEAAAEIKRLREALEIVTKSEAAQ